MLLRRLPFRCLAGQRLVRQSSVVSPILDLHLAPSGHRRQMHTSSPCFDDTATKSGLAEPKLSPEEEETRPQCETVKSLLRTEPSEQLFQVYGWARKVQKLKKATFVHLDDGSGPRIQLVIPNELYPKALSSGSSLTVTGRLVASKGSQQSVELHVLSLSLLGPCDPSTYEIGHLSPRNIAAPASLDFLRQRIHLRPRVDYFQSILRLRSELSNAVAIFMKQSDFLHVTTPLVTANDCEGGGEAFTLTPVHSAPSSKPYFGRPAYLSVSGQLHLEALAASLTRVYTLGPVFRAEKSMSPKHLSEFLMLEVEEAFLTRLDTLLDRVEALCKFLAFYLERNAADDLRYLREQNENYRLGERISTGTYIRLTYDEAVEILKTTEEFKNTFDGQTGLNLNAQMERTLVGLMDNRPVFVTHFPQHLKPFYMKTDGDKALCFDLLLPVCGEVAGGSLREDVLTRLEANIAAKLGAGSEEEAAKARANLDWYLDLRRFGGAPTGGFGLGYDRFLQALTGVANIKDVAPFPRWPYHCYL